MTKQDPEVLNLSVQVTEQVLAKKTLHPHDWLWCGAIQRYLKGPMALPKCTFNCQRVHFWLKSHKLQDIYGHMVSKLHGHLLVPTCPRSNQLSPKSARTSRNFRMESLSQALHLSNLISFKHRIDQINHHHHHPGPPGHSKVQFGVQNVGDKVDMSPVET